MYTLKIIHSWDDVEMLTFETLEEAELYLELEVKQGVEYFITEVASKEVVDSGKK